MLVESRRAVLALTVGLLVATSGSIAAAHGPPSEEQSQKRSSYGDEWVWIEGDVGYQRVDLTTFSADPDALTAQLLSRHANGIATRVGLGVRLWFITLGARLGVANLFGPSPRGGGQRWQLWTFDAELGARVPLGRAEPHVTLAGGYATLGGIDEAVTGIGDGLNIDGANARLGIGCDVYLASWLTIGIDVTGGLLFLARTGKPLRDLIEAKRVDTLDEAKARLLEADGSAIGTSLAVTARLGLRF